MASSDDEIPSHKANTKLTPFRVCNNGSSSRRRRSSIGSFALLQDEVDGALEHRPAYKGKSLRDRFIATSGRNIPLNVTPRSKRLAKVLGEAGDRRLCFHSVENVDPTMSPSKVVPFRREFQRLTRALYEARVPPSSSSAATNLHPIPETCLGAPGLRDDFYCRLADWSKDDLLAVAMSSSIVCRNMRTQDIRRMVSLGSSDCVTCVAWSPGSSTLGVGLDNGLVRMYDPESYELDREYKSHREKDFVGDFSWRDKNVFTVGYQSGQLRQFDLRERKGGKTLRSHKSRVCGVKWSPDGRFLATGGGDGVVVCWDARCERSIPIVTVHGYDLPPPSSSDSDFPGFSPEVPRPSGSNDQGPNSLTCRWRLRRHLSTVKAFAWCPWAPDILGSGGGTKDGTIRFWDVVRGRAQRTAINTNSQVTSLHFSLSCREIVSTHGYAFAPSLSDDVLPAPRKHSILVHNYPRGEQIGKVFDAPHGRITHSCLSPDGTRLMTCGSDNSIRIFKIFGKQERPPREDANGMQKIIR